MSERAKFWSDDFDMDLLKIFPDIEKTLRNPGAIVWTVGHESYGRLNHPAVWNTHSAFLWLEKPNLPRDEHGWFNVRGCVGDSPEIECTWIEWLRDVWPHSCAAVILPGQQRLPVAPQDAFMAIMYDLRRWNKLDADRLAEHRRRALEWVTRCDSILDNARKASPNATERAHA